MVLVVAEQTSQHVLAHLLNVVENPYSTSKGELKFLTCAALGWVNPP